MGGLEGLVHGFGIALTAANVMWAFVGCLLGTAVGFTVRDSVQFDTLLTVGGVWALFGAVVAMFVGGFIATQMAVGENKLEAAVHGVLTWGVVFALLLGMAALGIRTGFNALVGLAAVDEIGTESTGSDWERLAQRAR